MYEIVFDRLSPGQSQDRLWLQPHFGWVKSFFFIVVSLLLYLIPENLEGQHSTQKTANDTPKKCTQERIFEGNHISCPLHRTLQDWKNEFSSAEYVFSFCDECALNRGRFILGIGATRKIRKICTQSLGFLTGAIM